MHGISSDYLLNFTLLSYFPVLRYLSWAIDFLCCGMLVFSVIKLLYSFAFYFESILFNIISEFYFITIWRSISLDIDNNVIKSSVMSL